DELIGFYGKLCGMSKERIKQRGEELIKLVGLENHRGKKLGSFSKGMQQRAGLIQALLQDPQILILDEPMTGLDPLGRRQMKDILRSLRDMGKSIFFSSHELSEAESICDNLVVMRSGECIYQGELVNLPNYKEKSLEEIFLSLIEGEGR
ncbi:MAG: ABC transporter ATP-binding protein, partial [Lentisphaeria bacterium]